MKKICDVQPSICNFKIVILIVLIFSAIMSCKKDSFITNSSAFINTSADTLHFDTVFITTGSITQSFKIINPNNQKILLSAIELSGGANSFFKMNVDGTPGTSFSNISLDANDSIYVFVSVTINPNMANLPFIIQDSISLQYNGNKTYVQLDAYGQNARFLNTASVTQDTTWTNDLPVVILHGINILENKTLTINAGTKIYCHADAPINVAGTLKVNGGKDFASRVVFAGDRLDDPYKFYPGSWPGIFFNTSSQNNVLNYAIIKNAYQGIICTNPAPNTQIKLTINQCILDNIFDAAILAGFTTINATNCLISNSGANIYIYAGGSYSFNNCTAASFGNLYIDHRVPVLQISNIDDQNQTYVLNAAFINCIFYGDNGSVDDEISVNKQGSNAFAASFSNCLYKAKNAVSNATFSNCIPNQDPLFNDIDVENNIYDFHLQSISPCIGAGKNNSANIDLDGNARTPPIDIGCYQHQ